MTAQTSLYGRLTVDPQPHQTRTGTAMTSAKLAVDLPCKEDPEGKATWWVSLLAFGKQAELLAGHHKGDMVSASGQLQLNRWKAQDGTQRETHQLIADTLISAKTVRPGRKTSTANHLPPTASAKYPGDVPPFDDDLAF